MMRKLPDWELRLVDWARSRMGAPFEYGHTDCGILCFDAVDAMTGEMLAERYLGKWNSEISLKRYLVENRTSLVAALIALEPVVPRFHQVGDLIIAESLENGWECGHICLGAKSLSASLDVGVTLISTAAILAVPGQKFHILRVSQ